MKRTLAFLPAASMLLAFALPAVSFAASPGDVPVAGTAGLIGWFVDAAKVLKLRLMVSVANARIDALVRYAQSTPQNDVKWLLQQVDQIVAEIMAYADEIGATVECVYVAYEIDGQLVLIDPLRVVNVPPIGTGNEAA